ncbi:hypothetical protein FLL57_14120 [Rhodopseudomonas palustris]|nr:hypothetical protein FLL57_14120 [Rhodopseudomonas palustris]
MAGLVPAIHVLRAVMSAKTWMPGTRPGMTEVLREFEATLSVTPQAGSPPAGPNTRCRTRSPRR